jgi:hypothetical protein
MLQTVESDIRDKKILDLQKQCKDNECLIHMLEDSYKMSLAETNQMEIRFNEEEAKLALIVTLEDELRNIQILAKHVSEIE